MVRVRFAPSPTGPLHIGGVRTALYNYLFARKHNGTFILRIEDTDQVRYVDGAEEYIVEALEWFGLSPDESPSKGGPYGPYRQSERKDIYHTYVQKLLDAGFAYYAFDTPDELDTLRKHDPTFKYDAQSRKGLKNSISLSHDIVEQYIKEGVEAAVRLKIEPGQIITFYDEIRGEITFKTDELDDKVIMKADGMPTYHLANIVDDHLMKITHVVRGEEWLSSTPHHVLMYQYLGWESPKFAHLPLILKPSGQGKLSKRDGAQFGFPVFPLEWKDRSNGEIFSGFREEGFLKEAVINFLALLGWSPGNDEEKFTLTSLVDVFSLDKIVKSGARFDIDKALWFNQQYIMALDNDEIALKISTIDHEWSKNHDIHYLSKVCGLMKERVHKLDEILTKGHFFFTHPTQYDMDTIAKKYKTDLKLHFLSIGDLLINNANTANDAQSLVKGYIAQHNLKLGEILPVLRICISGTLQGPDLFASMDVLGHKTSGQRIKEALLIFEA